MTDTAVIAGLLGMEVDEARLPDALSLAAARGVAVSVETQTVSDKNPNTIELALRCPAGRRRIAGVSVGGGEGLVTAIDDHAVRLDGKHEVVLAWLDGGSGAAAARRAVAAAAA